MVKRLSEKLDEKEYTTVSYIKSILNNLSWQDSVKGFYEGNSYPGESSYGDRYIATDSFDKWEKDNIYKYTDKRWSKISVKTGMAVYSEEDETIFVFTGEWVKIENLINHDNLQNVEGGHYHLTANEKKNLINDKRDFVDISISDPSNIYDTLDHNRLKNYDPGQHIDWTRDQKKNISDDNIAESSILQYEDRITHNNLDDIKGSSHGYHLLEYAYKNLSQQNQKVKKDSSPNFYSITIDKEQGYAPNDVIRKDYLDKLIGLDFVWSPVAESFKQNYVDQGDYTGQIFIAGKSTNKWKRDHIYKWNGVEWEEYEPKNGYIFLIEDLNELYIYVDKWVPTSYVLKYTLSKEAYENLSSKRPKFKDLMITNPASFYNNIDHDRLKNADKDRHIDWTVSGGQKIHSSRIPSVSKEFEISESDWKESSAYYEYTLDHNLGEKYLNMTFWDKKKNTIVYPDVVESKTSNSINIYMKKNINMLIKII